MTKNSTVDQTLKYIMAREKLVILKNALVMTYTHNDMPLVNFNFPAKSRVPFTITPQLD